MGKIFKRAGIKLSTLIIAIVVFGVMFSTVGATLLFGVFYERTMFNSAYVSSKQSVSQANGTVSNYISSIKNKLDNLCDEADSCDSLQSLEKVVSTAARLEDDIYCVTIYDTGGNILLDAQRPDGLHQIRAPAQPETVALHGPQARDDGWQVHTITPSGLCIFNYTIVKSVLSTVVTFVKNFVFWEEKQMLLAFCRGV